MCAKSLRSSLTLSDPVDCRLPGSSVRGDSLGKNTGVGSPSPGDLPDPGIKPVSPMAPALQVDFLPLSHQGSVGWMVPFYR